MIISKCRLEFYEINDLDPTFGWALGSFSIEIFLWRSKRGPERFREEDVLVERRLSSVAQRGGFCVSARAFKWQAGWLRG